MRQVVLVVLVYTLTTVRSEPPVSYGTPNPTYGLPPSLPGDNYGNGGNGGHYGSSEENYSNSQDYETTEPQSYEFGYRVKDDYSGSNFHQKESSDGNQVRGEYRVALPDGRTQIVTYWADWATGFHADVKYEGEATYPENNGGQQPYGPPNGNGGYTYPNPSNQYGVPN